MRNNKYDTEHSYVNTPEFGLRTVLLLLSALYTGINVLVFTLTYLPGDREMLIWGIILCVLFAGAGVINIFDNRKGMKSRTAVIIWLVIYAAGVFAVFASTWTWLPVVPVAAIEVFIASAVILILHKAKKL